MEIQITINAIKIIKALAALTGLFYMLRGKYFYKKGLKIDAIYSLCLSMIMMLCFAICEY